MVQSTLVILYSRGINLLLSLKIKIQVISLSAYLMCFLMLVTVSIKLPAVQPEKLAEVNQFNQVAKQIEALVYTDFSLALEQLLFFENKLAKLTVEQRILYFKLLSEIYIVKGKYTQVKETANLGLELAKKLSSPSILITKLLYLRGRAQESLSQLKAASDDYKKGLEVAESLHNKVFIAHGLINFGTIYYLSADYQRSLVVLHDAYNIAKQTENDELKGAVNYELGILYSHLKQDKRSVAYYQQSYIHFKKAGRLPAAHNSLQNIAMNHSVHKRYHEAITVFKKIINESTKSSRSEVMHNVYLGLAWAYLKQHESKPAMALKYLNKAKHYINSIEHHETLVNFYLRRASTLFKLKRYDSALLDIAKVEDILANQKPLTVSKTRRQLSSINLKAKIFFNQGLYQQAYLLKSEAIRQIENIDASQDIQSVEQVRLDLESKQADLVKTVLQKQQQRQDTALSAVQIANKEQQLYVFIGSLTIVTIAWLLVKLIYSHKKLKAASHLDALTGVLNHRRLIYQGGRVFSQLKNKQQPLSLVLFDVDNLKKINAKHGYDIGDEVLITITKTVQLTMRKTDVFGRYSAGDFVLFLPSVALTQATEIAERIRLSIAKHVFNHNLSVTVSVGVACTANLVNTELDKLLAQADSQRDRAKNYGKNKVCS